MWGSPLSRRASRGGVKIQIDFNMLATRFGLVCLALLCGTRTGAADPPSSPCPTFPAPADGASVVAPGLAPALAAVRRQLAALVGSEPLPGLVATVVYDQTTLLSAGWGRANASDAASSAAPDGGSLVRVASISKVFTSLLLYKLRDAGVVGLDDAVADHIPAFSVRTPYAGAHPITLGQLASHTSGLPREGPFPCNLDGRCDAAAVYRRMARQYVALPQNQRFHYSNFGFGLLGQALAAAAAKNGSSSSSPSPSFEDLIAREVLTPLGIGGTFAEPLDPARQARVAQGIDTPGAGGPAKLGGLGWSAPCGGLWASAEDVARMMKLMFRTDAAADGGAQLLAGATVREALAPVVLLRDGFEAVGSPWEMKFVVPPDAPTAAAAGGGVWTSSKQGELNGYRSAVTLVPELKLGVFVSALQSDVSDSSVWSLNLTAQLVPPLLALLRAHAQAAPPPPLPLRHAALVGEYGPADELVTVSYSADGATLVADLHGSGANLTAFKIDDGAGGAGGASGGADDDAAGVGDVVVLRALSLGGGQGRAGCRWLDDGIDQELLYFQFAAAGAPGSAVQSLLFMGGKYDRRT